MASIISLLVFATIGVFLIRLFTGMLRLILIAILLLALAGTWFGTSQMDTNPAISVEEVP